jgi:hypothetical protein
MNKTCMLVRLLPPYTNHDMVNVLEVKGICFILFVDNLRGSVDCLQTVRLTIKPIRLNERTN